MQISKIKLSWCRGMATEMGVFDFSTAVAWKPLAIEALEGPPPLARLAARRWLWAGGLVPGGYPGAGPASLRLGARFGLPEPLLRAAWAAAYAAAAAALSVLWHIPGVNHVSAQSFLHSWLAAVLQSYCHLLVSRAYMSLAYMFQVMYCRQKSCRRKSCQKIASHAPWYG